MVSRIKILIAQFCFDLVQLQIQRRKLKAMLIAPTTKNERARK